jgi:carboxyl-terminal processing protease
MWLGRNLRCSHAVKGYTKNGKLYIMKKITAILLLSFNLTCLGQVNVQSLLDTVIYRTKEVSLYASTVNWDTLQKQVYSKATNAKTIGELKPAFEFLINQLRDHHGRIMNAKDYSTIAYFTDYKNHRHPEKRVKETAIWKIMNNPDLKFEYKILKGNIGYLKIVGIGFNVDIKKESLRIRKAVMEMADRKIDKWIIDLRYNAGGNMHPMMAGIAPLVGEGIVGSLVNLKNDKLFDWEIKNGNFIYDGYQAVKLPGKTKFKKPPPIAVLTSRWTESSGEIVATAFKGRPGTKFFGEATGGSTTNTNGEIIGGEIILNISTGIYCDRNGTAYEVNIPVDIEIPFEIINDTEKDNCIIAAKKWLTGK